MRFLAATLLTALALVGCAPVDSADPNLATPPPAGGASAPAKASKAAKAKPASTTRTITYRIGGTTSAASVTYSTPSGMEQQGDTGLPWKKSFKVRKDAFDVLTVSAQNSGSSGTVTCEIDVDGVKVKAAKSSGQYAMVSCDHSLGF